MSKIKLTYFDFAGGRGEDCRLALFLADIDFEDDRINPKDWPALKASTPYGALPIMQVEGHGVIAQSNAILGLIGKRHGLLPKDDFQAAQHLALLEAVEDFRGEVACTSAQKDPEARKVAREAFAQGYLQQWAKHVEQHIQGPFVGGDAISVADLKLYTLVNWIKKGVLDHVPASAFDGFAKLTALHHAVAHHPKVKAWYAR